MRSSPAALVLAAASVAAPVSAQITITRADVEAQLEATGTASSYVLGEAFDQAALQAVADRAGEGQIWDLFSFPWVAEGDVGYSLVQPPVPGSTFEGFSAATHIVAVTEADSTAYAYTRLTADAYEFLGVAAEVDDGEGGTTEAGVRFDPFRLNHPVPLTSSSAWSSTYAIETVPAFEGIAVEEVETSAVEGWGTLVLPPASAPVLKVRTKIVTTTTITIPGFPPMTTRDSSYAIEFVSLEGLGASIELDGDGVVIDASYGRFRQGATLGEAPPGTEALALALRGANPTRRGAELAVEVTAPATADLRLDVLDVLGRSVASPSVRLGGGPVAVPTGALPAGLYVVRATAGGQSAVLRVTVVD